MIVPRHQRASRRSGWLFSAQQSSCIRDPGALEHRTVRRIGRPTCAWLSQWPARRFSVTRGDAQARAMRCCGQFSTLPPSATWLDEPARFRAAAAQQTGETIEPMSA
jgi:hypothetical protein